VVPVPAAGEGALAAAVADAAASAPSPAATASVATKITGYIDRVDVAAIPPEQSARYFDGAESMEATVREFKSGQHWRAQQLRASGLRDKLRTLQPDIYGIAVDDMLRARPSGAAGRGGAAVRVAIESIELGSAEGKFVNARVASAARARIAEVAARIRAGAFDATPGEIACTYCGFNGVCESAFMSGRRARVKAAVPVAY